MTTPSAAPTPARTLTATCPEDVLAAVPVVLGFEPSESVVMLTFGGAHTFHARVDLPMHPGDLAEMTEMLAEPARRHGVRGVVLVVYTADADRARRAVRSLERALGRCRIEVSHALRADGTRWYDVGRGVGGRGAAPPQGVPYDLTTHRFRAESVLDGVVTHRSRDELAATLASDARAVQAVADAARSATPLAGPAVTASLHRHVERGTLLGDAELAAMVLGIRDPRVRDAAWTTMRRAAADEHVRVWSDAVRRTPPELRGSPAAVLAFSAWFAGHGALSWCAIDRCREVDPDNTLAGLVADLLTAAVPPSTWEEPLAEGTRPA